MIAGGSGTLPPGLQPKTRLSMAHTLTQAALATLLVAGSLRLGIAVWMRVRPGLYPRVTWDSAWDSETDSAA